VAVHFVEKLYPSARHALGIEVLAQQMGYKGLVSAASKIAALKQFGLLTEEKGGTERTLRLSGWGLDIGVDKDNTSSQRAEAIKKAALRPTLYAELWEKWNSELPPDGEIRRYLEREKSFNPKSVADCVSDYKSTLEFAGLLTDDTTTPAHEESAGEEEGKDNATMQAASPNSPTGLAIQAAVPKAPLGLPNLVELRTILDEGPVVLYCPDNLSQDSVEELQYWLGGIMRRARRKAGLEPAEGREDV
jgi:hypothetical protein